MKSTLVSLLVAAATASFTLGCGPEGDGVGSADEVQTKRGGIVGGWTISAATRRSIGLATVGNGCSASLIAPDWVITATHCINFAVTGNNWFTIPQATAGDETRSASKLYPLAQSDVTLVRLTGTSSTWPNVSHPVYTGSPSSLVGKDIVCYGQGETEYKSPSGLKNSGIWKQITKRVDHVGDENTLVVLANNGSDIMAPGDSGGPCYYGNQLVSESWRLDQWVCTDNSTTDTCKATLTRIDAVQVRTMSEFATYIEAARTGRAAATWAPLKLLNGWQQYPGWALPANTAASALVGSTVYLRGLIWGGSSSLFTLPQSQWPSATVYLSVPLVNAKKGRLRISTNGTVDVAAASGNSNDAYGAVWLDGVSFAVSASGRTAIPLQNQWTTAGYGTRGIAAQDDGGIVRLQGAVTTATSNTNLQPFVLPSSFRPSANIYVTVDLLGGSKGRALITSSGTVTIYPEVAGTSAQSFTSFEGVFFAKSGSGGTSLTPSNGWVSSQYGTNSIKVKNSGGIVMLRGAVETSGTSPYLLYLPEQFRPAGNVSMVADLCGGAYGRLIVQPDGWVMIQDQLQFGYPAKCFTSLEGIQFGI